MINWPWQLIKMTLRLSKEKYLENCNYISENNEHAKEQIQKLLDHKLFFLKKIVLLKI